MQRNISSTWLLEYSRTWTTQYIQRRPGTERQIFLGLNIQLAKWLINIKMRRTKYLVQEKLDVLCRVYAAYAAYAALYTQELENSRTWELEQRNTRSVDTT